MTSVISRALPVRPAERSRSQPRAELVRAQQTRALLRRAGAATNPIAKQRYLSEAIPLNMPVADQLALRYSGRGLSSQDLVQVARLGLVKAVRRFDPEAGYAFLSYAVPTVVGELKRHFRELWMDRATTTASPRPSAEDLGGHVEPHSDAWTNPDLRRPRRVP